METFLSGYCRTLDAARIVEVELPDPANLDAAEGSVDCDYGSCPHQGSCKIAGQIAQMLHP